MLQKLVWGEDRRILFFPCLLLLALTLLFPLLAGAQDTGYISGTVIDKSGAAVVGAEVVVANIAGSLGAGFLGNRMRLKWLLFWVYGTRALAIAAYLAAPRSALTFYLFATVLGLTWLSTVPPTAGLVGKLFGTRYLATLFGLTLLSHQIGGFFGAFLGGQAMARFGNYSWMWYADIMLALGAAFINLPIREERVARTTVVR